MYLILLAACSENDLIAKKEDATATSAEAGPDIRVEPGAVDYGEVLPGASAAATVTISNDGAASLAINGVSLVSANADVTWTALGSPLVAPGSSVETVVTWTPTAPGALFETLRVNSNDPDEGQIDVPLSGSLPVGDLRITPERYDFGTVDVGASESTTLTVENVGAGPIVVSDWVYTATDTDLRVLDAGGLSALPATLEAGARTEVVVAYSPAHSGADEGALQVTSDDPDSPLTVANQLGNAVATDPCDGYAQTVRVMLTADDAWQGWLDGASFTAPNQNTWSASDTMEWELGCGDHTLALYATDTAAAVSGVIAVVWVEDVVRFVSEPTNWTMVDSAPPSDWTDVGFDDSGWNVPQVCSDTSLWGSYPQPFYDQGAQWIWWTTQCRNLGEAWLRLNFTVP